MNFDIKDNNTNAIELCCPEIIDRYKLSQNRVFFLEDDMEDETGVGFCDECLSLAHTIQRINIEDIDIPVKDRKPIKLFIWGEGGSMHHAYTLVATIEQSVTPVWTINTGVAYSAAMLIFLAGTKRFCYKRSEALIHNGSGQIAGTYDQAVEGMASYEKAVKAMHDYILEKTSITQKLFNKNKGKDWFISDDEQVKYGIADKIVTSMAEIL